MEKKVYVFGDYGVINFLFAKEFRSTPAFHWAVPPSPHRFNLVRVPGGCEALVNYINRIEKERAADFQHPTYDIVMRVESGS